MTPDRIGLFLSLDNAKTAITDCIKKLEYTKSVEIKNNDVAYQMDVTDHYGSKYNNHYFKVIAHTAGAYSPVKLPRYQGDTCRGT